ncbi:hypothetical protein NHH03_10420 [Stieleria sp. TO1_6]|uniref:hypothetical protein n=1 Tax=Stieleria tagensis TaxID=2956795 RepID=UPI00209B0AD3|nr:hypothetical protein [Stieleria tagensis]MCO8122152.1 hypothetical protein [Stieleria tagensis]
MQKHNGDLVEVKLLRPLSWLEQTGATGDGRFRIQIEELDIDGLAAGLHIKPCPAIQSGEGQVVTGTFRHTCDDLVELQIEDEPAPIICTSGHPIWDATTRQFVAAAALESTSRTLGLGSTAETHQVRISRDSLTAAVVFNIEVNGTHVYHVGKLGHLVHNAAGKCDGDGSNKNGDRPSPRQSEIDVNGQNPNHQPQVSFSNGKEVPYGSRGSVRPDNFIFGESLEVKNYNLLQPSNRASLYNTIRHQYFQRLSNLPKGTHQRIVIDIRGQDVPDSLLMRVRSNILTITRTSSVSVEFLQ